MPYGVDYGEAERRIAIAIAEAIGTGGGATIKSGSSAALLFINDSGQIGISNQPAFVFDAAGNLRVNFPSTQNVNISDGTTAAQRLAIDAQGRAAVNNAALISSTLFGASATGVKLDPGSISSLRDAGNVPLQTTFTIATGATQSEWKTIYSPHKLLLLEIPAMTGASLQIRWRHPVSTGTANPIVDALGNPFSLTIGATGRTFSSDVLAPLARCVLGDGEISFVSNVAEGANRIIKLYY